jgi:hypothetical protein
VRGIADTHRDDGKRFVVRADEKLTAFVEIKSFYRGFRVHERRIASANAPESE